MSSWGEALAGGKGGKLGCAGRTEMPEEEFLPCWSHRLSLPLPIATPTSLDFQLSCVGPPQPCKSRASLLPFSRAAQGPVQAALVGKAEEQKGPNSNTPLRLIFTQDGFMELCSARFPTDPQMGFQLSLVVTSPGP